MGILYKKKLPSPEEYNFLRDSVGWGKMPSHVVQNGLQNTLYGISVFDGDKIIGSGRIVGDGGLCFYIQDIMVIKPYQKRGIGTKIVILLMEYLSEKAPYNSYIGLMAAKGLETFYSRHGFITRPNEYFGAGMTQFWGRNGEMSEE